jgi:cwf21 domain
MQYQDEIESGKKSVKSGWTMAQQVEHYRRKLIKKVKDVRVRGEWKFNYRFVSVGKRNR